MVSPWRLWADRLTLLRSVLGAPVLLLLASEQLAWAWLLLLIGALSDWADGWMARRADGGSSWGARLDPLADKLLISAPLIWLAADHQLPPLVVWLLLARELLAEEASGEENQQIRRRHLEVCLGKLELTKRNLLLKVHTSGVVIREVAQQSGKARRRSTR